MTDAWLVKRRPQRRSALARHRFVEASVAAGHSSVAFPGTPMPEEKGGRERWISTATSILLHALLVLALYQVAQLAAEQVVEKVIEVSRVDDSEPAPRPRAVSESSGRFAPAPMAITPQIVNPTVIQQRAPDLAAAQVRVQDLQPIQAPRNIAAPTVPEVAQARNFASPIAATTAAPRVVDTTGGPSLAPVDVVAPAGTTSGPRQVVTQGNTVGLGGPQALGTGSSVKEGIGSDRDVLGAKTGERASVNTAVGPGGGRGTGGDGTGPGGMSFDACMALPEVKAYMAHVQERVFARWRDVANVSTGSYQVKLGFSLDPSGSASEVSFRGAVDDAVGRSAAEAMRAASPFDPMTGRVRCLAGNYFTATFLLDASEVTN